MECKNKIGVARFYIVFLSILSLFTMMGAASGGEDNDGSSTIDPNLIVIDPGHGGKDPGAIGPGGIAEKNVVLKVALLLKEKLEKDDFNIIMTRDKDVFIPLAERSEIANKAHAGVFISVHVNAAKRSAVGFETYFLSLRASDDESRKLAMLENGAIKFEGGSPEDIPTDTDSDVAAILLDMAQTEYIRDSELLAVTMQDHLDHILESPNRGVKQAPFMVLMGASMPAALVELGFVSSKKEVVVLTSPEMQNKIAEALSIGAGKFAKDRAARLGRNGNPEKASFQ